MQTIPRHDEAAPDGAARRFRWITRGFFFASLALVSLKTALSIPALDQTVWPEALLILAATISILETLAQQFHWQNVLMAAAVIGLVGGIVQMIGALAGFPLGPFFRTQSAGTHLFNLPAAIPIAWIISLLASRGVAQLILRPRRQTASYGLWQIGLTVLLALTFYFNLESFALRENGHWQWRSTAASASNPGTPLLHFIACGATALLLLVLATPMLLKKRPVEPQITLHSLVVWTCLTLLFATAVFSHQLWPAVSCLTIVAAAFVLTLRGARS